jgi:hypothetical protein
LFEGLWALNAMILPCYYMVSNRFVRHAPAITFGCHDDKPNHQETSSVKPPLTPEVASERLGIDPSLKTWQELGEVLAEWHAANLFGPKDTKSNN